MCHTDGNGFPPGRVAPASLPPDEAGALVTGALPAGDAVSDQTHS